MRFGHGMLQDVRYCSRLLAKHPGFTTVAVLTLAVGIGANIAIFSVINAVFLRRVPAVTESERLVVLGRTLVGQEFRGFGHITFERYREGARSFDGLAAHRGANVIWRDGDQTTVLQARLVTGGYFSVLGVPIARGRSFLPEEHLTPGTHPVVILSHSFWEIRWDGDPAVIGRDIRLNDTRFTIVGVAADGFRGLELGDAVDIWLPLMMEAEARPAFPVLNSDFFSSLSVIGRLKPGVSREEAQAELAVLAARIEEPDGKTGRPWRVALTPHLRLPDPGWRAEAVSALTLLATVTLLVLLIACANLGSLLLARAVTRRREIAVRLALGAWRLRVVRQVLTESLVLAGLGVLAGLVVSRWLIAFLRAHIGSALDLGVDGTVMLFAISLATLTALLFGSAPAFHATRGEPVADLKNQRTTSEPYPRLSRLLVAGQVAVTFVLLAGAGLFARTLQKATYVEFGFDTENLLVVRPDLELAGYSVERGREFYRRLAGRIEALPGVESVSRAGALPRYGNWLWGEREIVLDGSEASPAGNRVQVEHNEVAPRYFETLGIRHVRGRDFTVQDDASVPRVGLINEVMWRQLWPGEEAVGKRLRFVEFLGLSDPIEIIGVVRDSRTLVLDDRIHPEIYVPLEQTRTLNTFVLARVANGSSGVAAAIEEEVSRLDPTLPGVAVETLAERLADGLSDQRLYAELTGLLGSLALLLAMIGLHGTLAYTVSQRSRDMGIRMALGARRGAVSWMVVREGMALAGAGIAAGLLSSFALTGLIENRLYGVTPTDPLTFVAASLVLMSTALLACWAPARRATRVDPIAALRSE